MSVAPNWRPVSEAAELWDVTPKTVRQWANTGVVSAVRVGPKLLRVDIETPPIRILGGGA